MECSSSVNRKRQLQIHVITYAAYFITRQVLSTSPRFYSTLLAIFEYLWLIHWADCKLTKLVWILLRLNISVTLDFTVH